MPWIALCLCLVIAQDPPSAPAPARDVVELGHGVRLEGEILEESAVFVKMRLGDDTVVGFERSRITKIERGAVPSVAAVPAALRPVDQWHVLHDGEGKSVGWMHAIVALEPDGRVRLDEEWRINAGNRTTEITLHEVAAADLEPISCFVHERTRRADGQITHERVVSATVEDGHLIVERRTLKLRDRLVYSFPGKARFLLAALEELRQNPDAAGLGVVRRTYDPLREEIVDRLFTADRRRRVDWQGRVVHVRELVTEHGDVRNAEWLDGPGHVLRREVNGVNLVALPIAADLARSHAEAERTVGGAALRVASSGRFGLWLPNPSWRFGEDGGDNISAGDAINGAGACLLAMDQIDPRTPLDSAADTVRRWLRLVYRDFETEGRRDAAVRGHDAVCLSGRYQADFHGVLTQHRAEVFVFSTGGPILVLCLSAPAREFATAQSDLDRIRDSLELEPEALAEPPRPDVVARRR